MQFTFFISNFQDSQDNKELLVKLKEAWKLCKLKYKYSLEYNASGIVRNLNGGKIKVENLFFILIFTVANSSQYCPLNFDSKFVEVK